MELHIFSLPDDVIRYMLIIGEFCPMDILNIKKTCKRFHDILLDSWTKSVMTDIMRPIYATMDTPEGILQYLDENLITKTSITREEFNFSTVFYREDRLSGQYIGILQYTKIGSYFTYVNLDKIEFKRHRNVHKFLYLFGDIIAEYYDADADRNQILGWIKERLERKVVFGSSFIQDPLLKSKKRKRSLDMIKGRVYAISTFYAWLQVAQEIVCSNPTIKINYARIVGRGSKLIHPFRMF